MSRVGSVTCVAAGTLAVHEGEQQAGRLGPSVCMGWRTVDSGGT